MSHSESPNSHCRVAVVMGSRSDWSVMKHASEVLNEFGVTHECEVVSAHRTPDKLMRYGNESVDRGLKVIIAGAGGAAHLPGMLAATTPLPVLGVPVGKPESMLRGIDALLSIVQMPRGIPVPTLAIGPAGAANAGLTAVSILALNDPELAERLKSFRKQQTARIESEKLP